MIKIVRKLKGIIVSEVPYKETSKIINVFTEELGIIGVVARGVKKLKSTLVISKLSLGYFHIFYKEKSLSNLIEFDSINNFKNIKKDIYKISYATFITELTTQVYKHSSHKDIFNLYISTLIKINEGYNASILTNILELKYLQYLGIMPVIDKCVVCSSPNNLVTVSSYKGGYLCSNCCKNEKIVDLKTIKLIRMLFYLDIANITKLDISDKIICQINSFIDDYYERYAGLYLKSKTFLKNLKYEEV
ncbi:MAG: DNA repair protein RecO [bacterium]|nr:DNA repair protein RecO [bacterium]